jgi:hypothetical protein
MRWNPLLVTAVWSMLFAVAQAQPAEAPAEQAPQPAAGAGETAAAAEEAPADEAPAEEAPEEPAAEEEPSGEEQAPADEPAPPPADQDINWFLGAQGRLNWVPGFIQEVFLDEAPTVVSPGFNVVGTYRSDGLSVVFGLGYASYAGEGPYRAKGDEDTDTEVVDSSLGLVYGTASLLWYTELHRMFAIEYGFGLDFGVVTGKLVRNEGYPDDSSDFDYSACEGVGTPPITDPDTGEPYCGPDPVDYDETGEHYDVEDGRVPPVVPVPSIPHLALRFAPDPMVALKLEAAYGIMQFWLGFSVHIGLDA